MINFNSGLQRIYLISSIGWILVFLFLGLNEIGSKYIIDNTNLMNITLKKTCEENFKKNGWEYRKIHKSGSSTFYKVKERDFIYHSNAGIKGRNDIWGSPFCRTVIKAPLFSRIYKENQKYIYLAFAPIPLYFLLLFVIDGFKQPNTKPKRKRTVKKK